MLIDIGNNVAMNSLRTTSPHRKTSRPEGDAHLLREVMRTHQAVLSVFSREVGMPASRLALMRLLAISPAERLGIMAIARQLGVNAAAVTRQVQEMEKERLVVRRGDARDKRRIAIQLSTKGRKVFQTLHHRSHKLERSLLAMVTQEEVRVTARVLATVRAVLHSLR